MAAGLPKMQQVSCTACDCSCVLTQIPHKERVQIAYLVVHKLYTKRGVIFEQGAEIDGCYLLCHGKVILVRSTRDGRKQILRFLGDGDLFGESGFSGKQVSSVEAQAVTDSMIAQLRAGDYQYLMKRYPPIAFDIQRRLSQEIDELRIRLTERSYRGARERLVRLLLYLAEKYGCKTGRQARIKLELTESELAEMLGNSREWICKQMKKLQRQGWIAYRRRKLVILDEAGLRQFVTPPCISTVLPSRS